MPTLSPIFSVWKEDNSSPYKKNQNEFMNWNKLYMHQTGNKFYISRDYIFCNNKHLCLVDNDTYVTYQ